MKRRISTIIVLMFAMFLLVGCASPYVKKLNEYKMQLAEGRDKAFVAAMEKTKIERLDVEDQYAQRGLESDLLISAYVRITGITPDKVMDTKTFSYEEFMKISNDRKAATEKRKAEIIASYDAFFEKILEEDTKIKAIQEGVDKVEEARQETYVEIVKTLGVVGAVTVLPPLPVLP